MSTPYAAAGMAYFDAGWSPLPLPPGQKWPPEKGFTGHDGRTPTRNDVGGWIAEQPDANLGIRLPADVLGIDVDHYGAKRGGDTIADAEAGLGVPLPATWVATSRPGTPSGIRLYRVPEGLSWVSGLPAVDTIHRGHRYVVAWPSVHPEGRQYVWLSPDGSAADRPPTRDELAELPPAWVDYLSRPATSTADGAEVAPEAIEKALDDMPKGKPCEHVLRAAGKAAAGGNRYDGHRDAVLALIGTGRRGCPGVPPVLANLRASYVAQVTTVGDPPRTRKVAEAEWLRMFLGKGVGAILADPQGTRCRDDLTWIHESAAGDTGPPPQAAQADPGTEAPPRADTAADDYRAAVSRKAAELRLIDDARELLAAERARATYSPPPVLALPRLIADTAAEVVRWRFQGLAEVGDRLLIEAAAKTGKSTLMGNLVGALVTGDPLLDTFATEAIPPGSVVLYVDTELGPRKLARWLADVVPADVRDRVAVWSIAGRAGSLDVRDDGTRARMVDQIGGALDGRPVGFLVVDVAAAWTAPLGIEENSNTEVRRFLESLHTFALDLGAEGLALAHHAGHGAERSRGASAFRDWPDVYATLTTDPDDDAGTRFLSATGRDVDLAESALTYDPATRRLSLAGSVGVNRRSAARSRIAADYADTLADLVADRPGMGSKELRAALADRLHTEGATVKRAAIGEAVKMAETAGRIVNLGDARKSNWHTPESAKSAEGTPPGTPPADDPPGSVGVSPGCPQGVPSGVPRVSPPEQGHGVSGCPPPYTRGTHTGDTLDSDAELIDLAEGEVMPPAAEGERVLRGVLTDLGATGAACAGPDRCAAPGCDHAMFAATDLPFVVVPS